MGQRIKSQYGNFLKTPWIILPIHDNSIICKWDSDPSGDPGNFTIWFTDSVHPSVDRATTLWVRKFRIVKDEEDVLYEDIYRATLMYNGEAYHLFETEFLPND